MFKKVWEEQYLAVDLLTGLEKASEISETPAFLPVWNRSGCIPGMLLPFASYICLHSRHCYWSLQLCLPCVLRPEQFQFPLLLQRARRWAGADLARIEILQEVPLSLPVLCLVKWKHFLVNLTTTTKNTDKSKLLRQPAGLDTLQPSRRGTASWESLLCVASPAGYTCAASPGSRLESQRMVCVTLGRPQRELPCLSSLL